MPKYVSVNDLVFWNDFDLRENAGKFVHVYPSRRLAMVARGETEPFIVTFEEDGRLNAETITQDNFHFAVPIERWSIDLDMETAARGTGIGTPPLGTVAHSKGVTSFSVEVPGYPGRLSVSTDGDKVEVSYPRVIITSWRLVERNGDEETVLYSSKVSKGEQ